MAEAALVRLVDRYFVWVVVLVGMVDAIGQALDAWIQRRLGSVIIWITLGVILVVAIYGLEIVKSRRDE